MMTAWPLQADIELLLLLLRWLRSCNQRLQLLQLPHKAVFRTL
jgi:hypothetical protein